MEWQPIETAPKDGRWVLLCGFDPDDDPVYGSTNPPAVVAFWREDDWGDEWAYCFWDSDWRSFVDGPTHWMPLPEPPETKHTDPTQ